MEKNLKVSENASERMTFAGEIFAIGERKRKQDILDSIPKEWNSLHKSGHIHIHDLDAFGLTYNCLTVDLRKFFPYKLFSVATSEAKIIGVFDFLKEFLGRLGNEQSGGMAFANFDIELAEVFTRLGLTKGSINDAVLRASVGSFYTWCNNIREKLGKVIYYVSLNIGLATEDFGRYICGVLLEEFAQSSATTIKPNIVFKVKNGVNGRAGDIGYSLFQLALRTTTVKMIPTYLLCDALPNANADPLTLAVMGCRTRVVDNKHGINGSVGRGNIANISINLPRIAMQTGNINDFYVQWDKTAQTVSSILEYRYKCLINRTANDFVTNQQYNLWCVDLSNQLDEVFKHGTLSIGFIGLSEAVEVLSGRKYYKNKQAFALARQIVEHMRAFVDNLRNQSQFNYSLLATSGELIAGRFTELDVASGYNHSVTAKGFYTNSFHVDVNSGLSAFDKISKESPFHVLCNGGCITYVELNEAPINNWQALEELVLYAVDEGIHYIGFNFNLDICGSCGERGVFDRCSNCGAADIIRVRRVSGYLEILDNFTDGKKKEVASRQINTI